MCVCVCVFVCVCVCVCVSSPSWMLWCPSITSVCVLYCSWFIFVNIYKREPLMSYHLFISHEWVLGVWVVYIVDVRIGLTLYLCVFCVLHCGWFCNFLFYTLKRISNDCIVSKSISMGSYWVKLYFSHYHATRYQSYLLFVKLASVDTSHSLVSFRWLFFIHQM